MRMRQSLRYLGSVNPERRVWEARITVIAQRESRGPPFAELRGGTAPLAHSLGKSSERGGDVSQLGCSPVSVEIRKRAGCVNALRRQRRGYCPLGRTCLVVPRVTLLSQRRR